MIEYKLIKIPIPTPPSAKHINIILKNKRGDKKCIKMAVCWILE